MLRPSLPCEQRGQVFVEQFDADQRLAETSQSVAPASRAALSAESGVVAVFAVERIFAQPAAQQVIAKPTSERVFARAAEQRVPAVAAEQSAEGGCPFSPARASSPAPPDSPPKADCRRPL